MLSLIVHTLFLLLALWGVEKAVEEPPSIIRLVFSEPPSPPPAPLGAPTAVETPPPSTQPSAVVEQPKVEMPKKPVKLKRPKQNRLTISKKKKTSELPPQTQPEPMSATAPETADATASEPPSGIATGATEGVAGGVVGGVTGGMTGGVIGGQGIEPVPANQAANPPILIARVVPEYPQQARRQRIEGLVLLEAVLDREGRIEDDIKVLQSIPVLDEAARRALRRWRFKPACDLTGRPLRVILEVPIRFVLK